ncbi:hypothetical protein [Mycolicibacterium mageritense]|uniref:hypothetical protein n=1 Tax=Mycolicibacterium mageritense TaxID=53462 RepID=UPI0035B5731D
MRGHTGWLRSCNVRGSAVLVAAALLAAGCSTSGTVVNTGETPQSVATTTTAPPPQFGTAHLVDPNGYIAQVDGRTGYYFSTPSGRWHCAILPRDKAGCQLAGGLSSGIGITGAPDEVPDGAGGTTTPNALAVDREHDAAFVALTTPEFSLPAANVLPFGKVLAVAGFRCNVQEEAGVSCVRELTGKGFTFSADGFTPQYTDVP